jgi:hypothetical protein
VRASIIPVKAMATSVAMGLRSIERNQAQPRAKRGSGMRVAMKTKRVKNSANCDGALG